jgi:putative ATP-binding cassette transporter
VINGLWPHGRGAIVTPRHVRSLYAAQDAKLQAVPLKDLVCLPDSVDEHPDTCVEEALRKAGLGEFIEELSKDGRNRQSWDQLLSGGEKQKLLLARILLLRPRLLFLDEATGALEFKQGLRSTKAIKDHCRDATVIVIMHDVSSIQSGSGVDFFDSTHHRERHGEKDNHRRLGSDGKVRRSVELLRWPS